MSDSYSQKNKQRKTLKHLVNFVQTMCFYSFLCVLLSGGAEAAGKLGPGHRVGRICAVLPAGGRRLGRVQPGGQQGGRSAAAVQQ